MEFFEVLAKRRSVRAFRKEPIAPEVMTRLLEAVRSAPTAGNLQAYQVYLVETPEKIQELAKAAMGQECVSQAAAMLVFCADAARSSVRYHERGATLYCIQDATIAATLAHLAATALGLGSVIVGAYREAEVSRVIGAPSHQRPVIMLPLGYPNETPAPTPRRHMEDLVIRK